MATRAPGEARHEEVAVTAVATGLATVLLVVLAGVILVAGSPVVASEGEPQLPRCDAITYTFRGSPPLHVPAEFELATQEIHQRSGLVFKEGKPETSKLVVVWSDADVTKRVSLPLTSDHHAKRVVAIGEGRWRTVQEGREFDDGAIEVDGTAEWPLGLDRGDGLASVFVHELGHVMGLEHSPEPASFMSEVVSPQPPRWTAADLDQLAQVGRESGC